MAISSTTNRVSYTGNAVTTAFPFPYSFQLQADLVVIETVTATGVQTTKALTTDYTISGSTDANGYYPNGGTVNAVSAPAATVTWTIYRDPAATQTVTHVNGDSLPASSIDNPIDKLTMIAQRLKDRLDRSLQQPEGDSAAIARLPAKIARASQLMGFDANGDPVAMAPTDLSSTSVTATGTTTSRTLAARFGQVLNVLDFGAVADNGVTDNSVKIQAAIDAARSSLGVVDKVVYIPAAPRTAGGSNGWYGCLSALKYYGGTIIVGDDMLATQLRFTNDSSGLVPNSTAALNSFVQIEKLHLRGCADTSAAATATVGLDTSVTTYCVFRDIYVERFVKATLLDSKTVGHGENQFINCYFDGSYFPNPVNSGPLYLIHVTGTSGRPQSNRFINCWAYSQPTGSTTTFTGDAATVNFDVDLGAGNLLYRHDGLKVDLFTSANGRYDRQAAPGAYSLFNRDSGSSVLIAPGAVGVGARHLRVTFVSAPAALANNVRLRWTDPWAAACIKIDTIRGNQNYFDVDVSGGLVGIDDDGGLNTFVVPSSQLCNTLVKVGSSGSRSNFSGVRVIDNSTIDQHFSINASATGVVTASGTGKEWQELAKTGADQDSSGTGYGQLTFDTVNLLPFTEIATGGNREVQIQGVVTLVSATNTCVGDIIIERSVDNGGTYTTIGTIPFSYVITGATALNMLMPFNAVFRDQERTVTQGTRAGNFAIVYYRVRYRCTTGTKFTIAGGANNGAVLRARNVNQI